jgi:flagellar hook protein FlgE
VTVLIDLERAVTGIGRSAIRHLNLEITLTINGDIMPDGTSAYTRDGAFQVDQNGQLVTNSGFPVQPGI